MVKKYLMTLVWRISQTGPILSLFFWSTALAGIFWPIVGITSSGQLGPLGAFLRSVGVSSDRITLAGLLILFFLFAAFILLVGWLYDRVLKLWREQMFVAMDRNPYAEDQLFKKEVVQWKQYYLPLAKAMYKVSPDPDLKRAIDRVEQWIVSEKVKDE